MVTGFIDLLIALLVGSQDGLQAASWTVTIGDRSVVFGWSAFMDLLITLLATVLVTYFVVKGARLNKIDTKK